MNLHLYVYSCGNCGNTFKSPELPGEHYGEFLMRSEIKARLKKQTEKYSDYEIFNPADYIDNSIALARINAGITQEELANSMKVTQAYISKVENKKDITPKLLKK